VLKLAYSNVVFQNFPGRTPGPSSSRGGEEGEGRGGEGGEREGRKEGKDREGRRGTGRDRRGKEGGRGGVGGEGRSTWAPPLETSSGSAPACRGGHVRSFY